MNNNQKFEAWFEQEYKVKLSRKVLDSGEYDALLVATRKAWRAAKAQAVPERDMLYRVKLNKRAAVPIATQTRAQILAEGWLDITDKQKDGELYVLLISTSAPVTFDDGNLGRVIGFNTKNDTGDDNWQLVGWDWCQDQFINFSASPTYYKPLPLPPTAQENDQ